MWVNLEKKIGDWEKHFIGIRSKESHDYCKSDAEYIENELVLLKEEKDRVQTRLGKIEEIIAKTHVLENDLNEDLCRQLSGEHSLAEVGELLKGKFYQRLKEGHDKGREDIRNFLEQSYKISKKKSRELFTLLEEVKIIHYWVDLPEDIKYAPLLWHTGEADDIIYDLNGTWVINTDRGHLERP